MEENKDRNTGGASDTPKDTGRTFNLPTSPSMARSEKDNADAQRIADETLVFRREPVNRNTSAHPAQSSMQHTAEIRGGAVIRPLKKTPNTKVGPAIPVNRTAQPAGTQNQPSNQPRQSSQGSGSQRNVNGSVSANGNRGNAHTAQANVQRQSAAAPQKPHVSPQSASQTNRRNQYSAQNSPKPTVQPAVTRKRTENDDYLIDEATFSRPIKKVKAESAFADNATSAIMSLVKAVVYIIAIIAVSVGLSVIVINTANDVFKFVVDDKVVTVEIPEYATVQEVTDALYDAGAIKYKWAFELWTNLKDPEAEFVPGVYEMSTTLNYDYLRATFKKSTKRTEVRVTIIEGSTVDEIIDLLVEKGIGTREAFVDVINNYDFDYRFLDELTVSEDRIWRLEGYLFPDTYNFYLDNDKDTNNSEVVAIKKLLDNFNRKFADEYYARCTDLGLTVDQAIILASMIEKETRYASELGDVSSVFHNRLKYASSFPYLNSDATIMYAIAHDTGSRLDTMTGEDTSYDTPYNTYKYKGLPPGPIANPGLNAIKYALYPNNTGYFYFVSDSNGKTLFAKTEAEHIKNINTVRGS